MFIGDVSIDKRINCANMKKIAYLVPLKPVSASMGIGKQVRILRGRATVRRVSPLSQEPTKYDPAYLLRTMAMCTSEIPGIIFFTLPFRDGRVFDFILIY